MGQFKQYFKVIVLFYYMYNVINAHSTLHLIKLIVIFLLRSTYYTNKIVEKLGISSVLSKLLFSTLYDF